MKSLLLSSVFAVLAVSSAAFAEESITGFVTTNLGFSYGGEIWIEGGGSKIRLFSNKAVVVYEDGSTANYSEAQAKLREDVEKNGTRTVTVLSAGNSFTKVTLLPRKVR